MKIAQSYSHLSGEEYLSFHHKNLLEEIKTIISSIDAEKYRTKVSKEKTMKDKMLYSPKELNDTFKKEFNKLN